MSIPVLGVPVLNRPDLLQRMLLSIDYPIEKIVIIDNGGMVHEDRLLGLPEHASVVHLPHNIGVSASWNLIFKVTPNAPYWFIVNHDIEFGKGDLARLDAAVNPKEAAVWHMLGFTTYAITPGCLHTVGFFDENFHPAYDEDVDYSRRCALAGVPRHEVENAVRHDGSSTIMSDPTYRMFNGMTHPANDRYYIKKWGGPKEGGEVYDTPRGRSCDLVTDWALDIDILRSNAWPRSR